jgi:hypothetical protein
MDSFLGITGLQSPLNVIFLVEKIRLSMIFIGSLECEIVGHSKCVIRKRIRTIIFGGRNRFCVTILFRRSKVGPCPFSKEVVVQHSLIPVEALMYILLTTTVTLGLKFLRL